MVWAGSPVRLSVRGGHLLLAEKVGAGGGGGGGPRRHTHAANPHTLPPLLHACRVHKFQAALFATAATVTVLNMFYADTLLTQWYQTEGNLRTRGIIAFIG